MYQGFATALFLGFQSVDLMAGIKSAHRKPGNEARFGT